MTNSRKGALLVLVAGASWGVISLFIRALGDAGLSPIDISSFRSICTALVLLASVSVYDRGAFKVKLKDLWCMAGCGVISITFFNALYFATIQMTTVNIAVVLLYTSPVFVTVMACIFFRERFTLRKLVALILVLVGCALVSGAFTSGKEAPLSGKVLLAGIGAGFLYSLYSIFGRCARNRGYNSSTITLWVFITAGIASLFLLNFHRTYAAFSAHPTALLALAGLVVISTILPYVTYTEGLKYIPPSSAAIIVAIEPVVGTLVGTLLFGEPLPLPALAGMALVLISCILA